MKSKLILLDANVIIEANRLGFWKTLYSQFAISVPSGVVRKEVQFFRSKTSIGTQETPISLEPLLASGEITEASASISEMAVLTTKFKPTFLEVLGGGEKEAIALMLNGRVSGARFATADGPAIKALGALMMGESGVSFEELLLEVGQKGQVQKLQKHFLKSFFDRFLAQGRTESSLLLV